MPIPININHSPSNSSSVTGIVSPSIGDPSVIVNAWFRIRPEDAGPTRGGFPPLRPVQTACGGSK
jgi:hypothetical protein